MKNKLIIFTRYPEAGHAKTRLIPCLGAEGAAILQRRMTEQAVKIALLLAEEIRLENEIRFTGGSARKMKDWLGPNLLFCPQGRGDLGIRLSRASRDSFRAGAGQVVIIGADCPNLSSTILATAFAKLAEHDLVVGPATDGGYYLIGLSTNQPGLFHNLPWGTNRVLPETLTMAEKSGLSFFLLEELCDVDRPEDLSQLLHDYPEWS